MWCVQVSSRKLLLPRNASESMAGNSQRKTRAWRAENHEEKLPATSFASRNEPILHPAIGETQAKSSESSYARRHVLEKFTWK